MTAVIERFDKDQLRDPDGTWGDGMPGPGLADFDLEGFDLVADIDGSFGNAVMGVDSAGDVRLAFREGNENRELDLTGDEFHELGDALQRLVDARDDLDEDAETGEVQDEYGFGDDHKVELYGNGVISLTFGADDPDPWTLNLDPPDGDDDDAQLLLDAMDDVFNELDAKRSRVGGRRVSDLRAVIQRKFDPGQKRDAHGRWGDGLGLEGRIQLADGERLLSSGRLDPDEKSGSDSFADVMTAVVETPTGRHARIGIIPHEDAGKWKAGNRGATVQLDAIGVEKLRADLQAAQAQAKKAAAAADKIWANGGNGYDFDTHVTEGSISGDWGDLNYDVSLTDDEPTSWLTSVEVGAGFDGSKLDARDAAKLIRMLAALQAQLSSDAQASRAYSPKQFSSRAHSPGGVIERKFDPLQDRDGHGRWTDGSVGPLLGAAALDAPPLNLAGMETDADPRATALWFRTGDNSRDTKSGMPGFIELNKHLRNPSGLGDQKLDDYVTDIDSAMRDSRLKRPIEVYRGVDIYDLDIGSSGDLVGKEFTDKAFASTTTDEAHGKTFGTLMRIHVPKGVGAVRMADRDGDLPESEILLDRDLRYRVTNEHFEHDSQGRMVRHVIDVEVVP